MTTGKDDSRIDGQIRGAVQDLERVIAQLSGDEKITRKQLVEQMRSTLARLQPIVSPTVINESGVQVPLTQSPTDRPSAGAIPPPVKAPPPVSAAPRAGSVLGKLSAQGRAIVEGALAHERIKVNAGAGCGKTTALVAIAESLKGLGTYIAYNKDVKRDAEGKFPSTTVARTGHALAYAAVGASYQDIKPIREPYPRELVRLFGLDGPDAYWIASAVNQTVGGFCNSADGTVMNRHVPTRVGDAIRRNLSKILFDRTELDREIMQTQARIVTMAQQLWDLQRSKSNHEVPITHDGYLKAWQLGNPTIQSDFILFDEAQDITPAMLSILMRQKARLVAVGDQYQAIYQWRGAINAMAEIEAPEFPLTHSYRFGEEIARAANSILAVRGAGIRLAGAAPVPGLIGDFDRKLKHTIIARTNAALCMRAAALCTKVPTSIVGGAQEITTLIESAYGLYTGNRQLIRSPLLEDFRSYQDLVRFAEQSGDRECTMLVRLVEEFGPGLVDIIGALKTKLVDESSAHAILTTAHKSKGREWDHVVLEDDFRDLYDGKGNLCAPEELNLLYVAATRARRTLTPNAPLLAAMARPQETVHAASLIGAEVKLPPMVVA